ncbi:hypothetical protein Tco_1285644 [Tanacetum coccineum]
MASASSFENGKMEITATIDGRIKAISEASIRRHLNLKDSDGIQTLRNTEIFGQLALIGRRQGLARVHEEDSTFNAKEWVKYMYYIKLKADKEFAPRRMHKEREYYKLDKFAKVVSGSSKIDVIKELNQELQKTKDREKAQNQAEESKDELYLRTNTNS